MAENEINVTTINTEENDEPIVIEATNPDKPATSEYDEQFEKDRIKYALDIPDDVEHLTVLETAQSLEQLRKALRPRFSTCYEMLNTIMADEKIEPRNKKIVYANIIKYYGFTDNYSLWIDKYENVWLPYMDALDKELQEKLNNNKERLNSSKYMSEDWISILQRQKGVLETYDEEDHPNLSFELKRYDTMINIIENRTSIDYLKSQFDTFLKSKGKDIKKTLLADAPNFDTKKRTKVTNELIKAYSARTTVKAIHILQLIFADYGNDEPSYDAKDIKNYNPDMVYVFMMYLNRIAALGEKDGKFTWAKVLILNLADMYNQIYDYEEPKDYLKRIRNSFFDLIFATLYKNADRNFVNKLLKTTQQYRAKPCYFGLKQMQEMPSTPTTKVNTPIVREVPEDELEAEAKADEAATQKEILEELKEQPASIEEN